MAVKITQNGIDKIQDNTVSNSQITNDSIKPEDFPEGVIVQVAKVQYNTRTSFYHSTSDFDVPGMSLTLTPKLNNSKYLISVRSFCELDASWDISFNIKVDNSRINIAGRNDTWNGLSMAGQSYAPAANNNDSTPELLTFTTLWTSNKPAGVPINIKLSCIANGARTSWINGCFNAAYETGTSEIIVYEIKNF